MAPHCLTLKEKIDVINYKLGDKSHSVKHICEKFKIGRTQAFDILKKQDELLNLYHSGSVAGNKIRMLRGSSEIVDKCVAEWFVTMRNSGVPVTGPMLQEKALEVAKELGMDNYKASNGWLHRFKVRHGVVFKSGPIDVDVVNKWVSKCSETVESYEAENTCNPEVEKKEEKGEDVQDPENIMVDVDVAEGYEAKNSYYAKDEKEEEVEGEDTHEDPENIMVDVDVADGYQAMNIYPEVEEEFDIPEDHSTGTNEQTVEVMGGSSKILCVKGYEAENLYDTKVKKEEEINTPEDTVITPIRTYEEALIQLKRISEFYHQREDDKGVKMVNDTILHHETEMSNRIMKDKKY